MKRLFIEDAADIAKFMYTKVCGSCEEVTFIGLYEDAIDVLKALLMIEEAAPYQISIEPEEWDWYDKEFMVTLDDNLDVWCEKAYRVESGHYVKCLVDCVLIADDCNEEVLEDAETDEIYEVSYNLNEKMSDEDDECDGDCAHCNLAEEDVDSDEDFEECDNDDNEELLDDYKCESSTISRTKDGKIAGFTKTWSDTGSNGTRYYSSFSHYGNNEEAVKKCAREFGIDV